MIERKGVFMRHYFYVGCILFLGLFFSLTILVGPGYTAEGITIISPQKTHFAGQPVLFHIQTKEVYETKKMTAYYRAIGVTAYRRLILKKQSPIDFMGTVKAQKVIPPGIEFFFVVVDGKDRVFTFPKDDPKKNPYALQIDLDKMPPRILDSTPSEGAAIEQLRPSIKISFKDIETYVDKNSVRLVIDGTDVTQLSEITETKITYAPAQVLSVGNHTIAIELSDMSGNRMPTKRWAFSIPAKAPSEKIAGAEKASAEVNISGEFRRRIVKKEDTEETRWNFQSTATIKSSAQSGKLKTSFDATVNYIDQEGHNSEEDRFNLNNFLYKLEYGKQLLALGDVTVEGTDLISKSISRRGGRLSFNIADTKAEAFALRSNYVTGFEHGLGMGDPNQRFTGGFIEKDLIGEKKLTVKATYVNGKNENPDNYNTSTLEAGTEGNIYSIVMASRLFEEKLNMEGEYSGSTYDSDVADTVGQESDKAWRAKISSRYKNFDCSTGYKYLGPDFRSIVNATGANDREEYNLEGGMRFKSSNLRLNMLHNSDNVDEDPLMPVIRNTTGTLSYNLSIPDWPSFFANYTQSQQESAKEPTGYIPIENKINTIGGGFSIAKNRWNISPGYTYTSFDDRGETTNNDSEIHVATLTGGFRPTDTISINPSVTHMNITIDATGVTTKTWQGALAGYIMLFKNQLNLNTTLSVLDTKADDGSTDTTTYSAIAQLNWRVEKYLLKKGSQTLSLRGNYSKTENHINHESTDDFTIYAVISFGIPIKLF